MSINTLINEIFTDSINMFNCPSCDAEVRTVRYRYMQDDKESWIYRCAHCSLMFARPIFIHDISHRQMDSVDDAELFNNSFLKKLHEHLIIKREIRHVRKIFSRKEFSLLDIGCGTGWTSSVWKKEGAQVTGLEPSAVRGKIAEERYGLRIISSYIEELVNTEHFDVIVMRHVLEHLENPLSVLSKVKHHLHKKGLLVIVVPNIDCIGRFIFGTRWAWVLPWHCNFFNPGALSFLLERAGFETIKSYQTPSPLWYPESFLRTLPFGKSFVEKFYNRLSALSFVPFAPFIAIGFLLGLSDNLTIIARSK